MWIEHLDVAGFKQLHGVFAFGRGLTVVHGPNEAGKSALQDAMLRALFGFTAGERRMRNGASTLTAARPWSGGRYGVSALVHGARDGRSLRIAWNFAEHTVTVHDADTGEDLSATVRGQRQEVSLGRWLFGLELDDYRQACCLFQAAVEPVVHSDGLVGALRAAVERGAPDGGGVGAADELLRAFLGSRLGLHGRWYSPLPSGESARIDRELDAASAALGEARTAREEIAELSVERAALEDELAGARQELFVVEQRLRLTDVAELRQRGEEVERQRVRLARRPERPTALSAEDREQVAALRRQVDSNQLRVAELRSEVACAADRVGELEAQRREDTLARDRLDVYADWDASAEDLVRELHGRLGALGPESGPLDEAPPVRDPELARYRAEREHLRKLAHARRGGAWRRGRLVIAGVLTVLSAVGATVSPLALVGLVLAALVVLAARPRASARAQDPLVAALSGYGVDSLAELERRAVEEDQAVAAAEGRREERTSQARTRAQTRAELERRLHDALTSAGASSGALDDAVAGYLTGCARHAERERLSGRLDALDGQLLRAREPQRDLDARVRELAEHQAALLAAYTKAGAQASDLNSAAAEYEALAVRAQADEAALAEAREAEEALRVALSGRTPEQLQSALTAAEARLREHVAQHGELTLEPAERAELQRRLADLHGRIEANAGQASALAARIEEREAASGDPAALEEHIAILRDRQRRYAQAGHAIRLAREGLTAAAREAHRAFAPHLNAALARDLPRVTGGRYTSATIGDGLEIKVVAPETGELVPIQALSRGTQDQIALVERLAIARMLDPATGCAPLLLDDPFGHTDPDRRRQALELLSELAAERQIIIATDDPGLAALAERVGDVVRIDLPAPTTGAPVGLADKAA